MSLILQIPPVEPSASLRTAFLLRLTGDALSSISGYPADLGILPELIDWLDDLDQAWICVLRSQVWVPPTKGGADLTLDTESDTGVSAGSPMSQTERTRLRSLLVAGEATLEVWLAGVDTEEVDLETTFERLGVQDKLDNIFSRTLQEVGGLGGTIEPGLD